MRDAPYKDDSQNYLRWLMQNNVLSTPDYDMRSFYRGAQAGDLRNNQSINPNDGLLHFTDRYKLPNHPTFSTESNYYDQTSMPQTPSWSGGNVETKGGNALNAESWILRRPNGEVVSVEAPWRNNRNSLMGGY